MNPFIKAVQAVAKPVAKAVKTIGRNKPEIMVGAGIVAVVGSFVWVAINATKAPEKANETVDKVKDIEEKYKEELETAEGEKVTETLVEQSKELRKARFDGAVEMAKLFAPPAAMMTAGLVLIFFGHRMRWKEVIVLSTEVKGLKEAFRFYRQNVIEKEGKEKDLEYLRGVVGEKEIQKIGQDECGNDILKKEKVPVIKEHFSPWRFEYSPAFFDTASGNVDTDVIRLKNIQDKWDKRYNTTWKYRKISMWDILNDLGANWEAIEGSFPGCANYREAEVFTRNYGWGHDIRGDGYIDLGIWRAINDGALVGRGECVYMELNCDGNLNKIENQYKKKYCMA